MISWNHLPGLRKVSNQYKDLFTGRATSYSNLVALFCYFLFGSKNLSAFVRSHPWSHSVSDLSRAIKSFHSPRWMRRMRHRILRLHPNLTQANFCLAIDDTDNPKSGAGVFNIGHWHGSKGRYLGQRIVVLALVDLNTGIALPLSYRIAAKADQPGFSTANDLAIEMLAEITQEGFPTDLNVVCDSWFDGVQFIRGVRDLGYHLVVELKSNRNVKRNPGKWSRSMKLPALFRYENKKRLRHRLESFEVASRRKKGKCGAFLRLMINGYSHMLACVAVYNRRNGAKAFAYWVSTDLSMNAEQIWEHSRGRWRIECLFRDLKQNLSFGRLPCASKEAADLSICLPLIIYTSLRLEFTQWGCEAGQSIGKMVASLRQSALDQTIEKIQSPHESSKLNKLVARRNKKRVCKKPVDQAAEEYETWKKAS